jgi:predicted NBD/HSP70 family sugar kinase
MSVYIGLDVHKNWTFVAVIDKPGRVVDQRRLLNEYIPSFLEPFNVEKL